jgi:hypothetical protein
MLDNGRRMQLPTVEESKDYADSLQIIITHIEKEKDILQ